ncbi:putative ribonuclease H-like domain-containing protein [Tanacetum coccineum]
MQKNVLKHQFENFTTTPNESLDKAYDRFQKLISQLEVYAASVSKEDINQKFLRSLPPSWSQIALIMRNKPDIDQTDIDDLYNNLKVYEDEMKRSSSSTSNSQNLAFLSSENTSRTNEVSTTSGNFGVNTAGGTNSSSQVSSTLGADEVVCSFFAQQTTSPPLDNEDLKGHFAKECKSGWNQGKRSNGDNSRRHATNNEPSSQVLVAQDGLGDYDWSNDFDEPVKYALMAISSSSSSSSSNNEVQNCSKQCLESFKILQKNFDSEREKHSRARLEIQGYELALESLESRILGHEKNELAWGEKYEFQNYELKCRELKINNLNMELEKVVKERDELNIKITKWEESSKSLNILLNSQMSAHDKNGLGYGTQLNEMSDKSKTDSEISMSVFEVRSSDEESTPANDRFSKADGYHVVPPPITGNFLTPRADISFAGLDEYAIRKKIIESKTTKLNADTSKSKTSETVGNTNEVNVEKPKSVNESVVSTPNINKDKVIIEDWNSDDENDVSEVSPVKTNETQTAKTQVDKIGQTSKKAGIGFKKIKSCFVCKSTDHLIKDCDFYDKKSPEPKLKNVVNTGQRVVKPVWDNAKRVNHQKISNKLNYPQARRTFVPSGVLTRTGLVNPVRPNEKRAVQTINTARPVSTARSVSTARPFAPKIAQTSSVVRPIYPRMDNVNAVGIVVASSHTYWQQKLIFQTIKITMEALWLLEVIPKETECLIMSPSFKLLDESKVVLRAPRKDDVYSLDLKNSVPSREAVNTACYVLNRVLVTKPQNKIPYELLIGKPPSISFMRPFGCPLTILNTLDPLGKFDRKSDEGYLLGYSTTSKAFRVYNKQTKRVEENLHIDFLEYQPNMAGSGLDWMFDLDFLTNTMNYILVSVENQITMDAGTQESYIAGSSGKDKEPTQEYILLPLHPHRPRIPVEDVIQDVQEKSSENASNDKGELDSEDIAAEQTLKDDLERMVAQEMVAQAMDDAIRQTFEEEKRPSVNTANTPYVSADSTHTGANAGESSFVYLGGQIPIDASTLPNANLPTDPNMHDLEDVSNAFPNDGIFSGADNDDDVGVEANFNNMDHTIDVGPITTLRIHKNRTNHKDHQNCLLACFLSQVEPKTISQALEDEFWVEAMQEKLLQFILHKVWILVNLPFGKKAIGTKWVFGNKRDERSIVLKNKARLVAQGFRQEEGFVDPAHPNKVYKVIKALYGLHQAPRAWYETLSTFLLENGFRRGTIDKTLFIKKNKSDIMLVQVYVDDIIFGSTKQSMCTEFEDCMHKRFQMSSMGELTFFLGLQVQQQPDGIFISQDKSMIGSLMYLTASRPDIMFAVYACARFQVTPKASHLNAVKRIFRYLKHQPKLRLWYPKDSPFELEAFSDSDYGGASLDRKSTTEYVAAANCCGKVLWIQNQMMDYGFNFMHTKIHIDNKSTICIVKNPVYHSRTKHIEIRHHFIRDCYEKRLIDVFKIHTDNNVADLLTKGFDVIRFNFLVVSIGMLNL